MITSKDKILMGMMIPVIAGITGCSAAIEKADKDIDKNINQINKDMLDHEFKKYNGDSVVMKNELYVAGESFHLTERESLPDFFSKKVSFNQLDPVSFTEIMSMISQDLGTRIVISEDAIEFLEGDSDSGGGEDDSASFETDIFEPGSFHSKGLTGSNILFSLEHKGDFGSLLDAATNKANLFWRWNKNHIEVFRHTTKTFVFDGDPTKMGFNASVSSGQSGDGGGGEGGSNGSISSMNGTSFSSEVESAFSEIDSTLESIMSRDGRSSISQASGIISVTDTPRVLETFGRYIEGLNSVVNKKIAIRAEVYEITSDDNGQFGIDWNSLYTGSSNFNLNLDTSIGGDLKPSIEFGIINSNNNFSGTKAFVNAINEVSKMSLVTSTSIFTTNGQPAPVQIADQIHYLKGQTTIEGEEGKDSEVKSEAGTVLTGFTMSVNPRINSKGDISMRFAIDMSQLVKMESISKNNDVVMQLPNITSKNFVQKVIVSSGETMMIAGFERTEKSSLVSSLGNKSSWIFGGSKKGGEKKVMTMILLTPYVMAN